MSNWTLFSNHGHVLVCLARDSEARLRDVAADVGITERAVQKIVRDLQEGGMISVSKHGRRNRYRIHKGVTMRHDLEAHCTLGELIQFVRTKPVAETTAEPQRTAPWSSRSKQEEPGPEKPRVEELQVENTRVEEPSSEKAQAEVTGPEQPETEQPAKSEPEEVHAIERQQRSLF
jgi:DNA-binding Lrp family transcriptional regulator